MSNRTSFVFGLIIVGLILIDLYLFGTLHMVFLGKKMAELIEWIAFWR